MITITTQLIGALTLELRLSTLLAMRFEAFHREAADYMKSSVQENYRSKTAPDGTPWQPHGQTYPKWLADRGGSLGDVLRLTGKMFSSVTAEGNQDRGRVFYRSEGYGDKLHDPGVTTDRLAFYHTIGSWRPGKPWVRVPKRPQMGFSTGRGDVANIEAMLRRFVVAQVAAVA